MRGISQSQLSVDERGNMRGLPHNEQNSHQEQLKLAPRLGLNINQYEQHRKSIRLSIWGKIVKYQRAVYDN